MDRISSPRGRRRLMSPSHRAFMVGVAVFIALIWIALICALVALAMDPAAVGRLIGRIVAGAHEVSARPLALVREV